MNLTASKVRLHDKQIYNIQAHLVRFEEGLKQLTDVTNSHIYASHQINVALRYYGLLYPKQTAGKDR